LLREELIKGEQPGDSFKEKGQLFLNHFRLVENLAVRPAEHAPALVDQAVLSEKVILVLLDGNHLGGMPHQPIDLEGDFLIEGPEGVVDEARSPVDVIDREFGVKQLRLLHTEYLREEKRESVLRRAARQIRWHGWPDHSSASCTINGEPVRGFSRK